MAAVANFKSSYSDYRYWESLGWKNVPRHPAHDLKYSHIDVRGTCDEGAIIRANHTILVGEVNAFRHESKGQGIRNRAVDDLRSKLRPGSGEWLSLIATYNESARMIENRSLVLFGIARNFFSRKPKNTARALRALKQGLPPSKHRQLPSAKSLARASADKASKWWLEWWWGLSPLISDLRAPLRVLASEPPSGVRVRGTATNSLYRRVFSRGPVSTPEGIQWNEVEEVVSGKCSHAVQCRVYISNLNLHLANSLGLLNPFATAWEVTPYSWLVNWFVNVDSWLDNWSWDFGLTIKEPCHTVYTRGGGFATRKGPAYSPRSNRTTFKFDSVKRALIIPTVSLRWSPPDRLAITRAASAVSLLTQFLLNPRKTA